MTRILYQIPFPKTQYAYRSIYHGFKNAFQLLGNDFFEYTASDSLNNTLTKVKPDIFIIYLSPFHVKFIDFDLVKHARKKYGTQLVTYLPYWNSPISSWRINEAPSLVHNLEHRKLITSGLAGDIFVSTCEEDDYRMSGFSSTTGKKFTCIPLAADQTILENVHFEKRFNSDISYVGTNLPQKKQSFNDLLYPLKKQYKVSIYGQDWKITDQSLAWLQRFGQFFNLKLLTQIRLPSLSLLEEANIYYSSTLSVNIHEEYQRRYGGDCNERTFKIPLYGGFEIVDNVACISNYFQPGKEIIVAKDASDWFEKINYYYKNPLKRKEIIRAGQKRVLSSHTYVHRAQQLLKLANL